MTKVSSESASSLPFGNYFGLRTIGFIEYLLLVGLIEYMIPRSGVIPKKHK